MRLAKHLHESEQLSVCSQRSEKRFVLHILYIVVSNSWKAQNIHHVIHQKHSSDRVKRSTKQANQMAFALEISLLRRIALCKMSILVFCFVSSALSVWFQSEHSQRRQTHNMLLQLTHQIALKLHQFRCSTKEKCKSCMCRIYHWNRRK